MVGSGRRRAPPSRAEQLSSIHDPGQFLRRGLHLGDERRHDRRLGRKQQHPAEDGAQLVEAELKPGGHPEIAAAADGPEEVSVVLGVHADQLAVGGNDLGSEQVIDREPVLANEEAGAAA
jgi:hypothetical protein